MRHITKIKVRFSDTDMFGHVNNAKYFTYMEEARTTFLQDVFSTRAFPLILASAKVDFLAQTFFGQTLRVESFVPRIGNSSFDVSNRMFLEDTGQLVFEGAAVLVHYNYETQRSERIPEEIREQLSRYREANSANP